MSGQPIRSHEHAVAPAHSPLCHCLAVGWARRRRRRARAADVVYGMDVSGYQGNVDWATAYANGARFAYVKATEGTGYTNPYFAQQYNGSYDVGMIRGAYHFALPDNSSGATQADYFVDHGGGWSGDGKTLPGALDIEYNPYGADLLRPVARRRWCSWIRDFSNEYHARDRRLPDDLHHDRLVDDLHRQLPATSARPTRCGSRATARRAGHAAGRLGLLHVLAVRRLRHLPGRPGPVQRRLQPAAGARQRLALTGGDSAAHAVGELGANSRTASTPRASGESSRQRTSAEPTMTPSANPAMDISDIVESRTFSF